MTAVDRMQLRKAEARIRELEAALLDDPLVDDLHDVLNELKAFADQGAERTADPVGARSRIGWLSRAIRRSLSAAIERDIQALEDELRKLGAAKADTLFIASRLRAIIDAPSAGTEDT